MDDEEEIRSRFALLAPHLDERTRRLAVAAEAKVIELGGISIVARATGVSRPTIRRGLEELTPPADALPGGVRKPGGGRKKTVDVDSTLKEDLEKLALADDKMQPFLTGKQIVKIIVVPDRLVNVVVKG